MYSNFADFKHNKMKFATTDDGYVIIPASYKNGPYSFCFIKTSSSISSPIVDHVYMFVSEARNAEDRVWRILNGGTNVPSESFRKLVREGLLLDFYSENYGAHSGQFANLRVYGRDGSTGVGDNREVSGRGSRKTNSKNKRGNRNSIYDREYLELIEDLANNESSVNKLVSQAAKANGYTTPLLFHGMKLSLLMKHLGGT